MFESSYFRHQYSEIVALALVLLNMCFPLRGHNFVLNTDKHLTLLLWSRAVVPKLFGSWHLSSGFLMLGCMRYFSIVSVWLAVDGGKEERCLFPYEQFSYSIFVSFAGFLEAWKGTKYLSITIQPHKPFLKQVRISNCFHEKSTSRQVAALEWRKRKL